MHTCDTGFRWLDVNFVKNWTLRSSVIKDAHFNLHAPWLRVEDAFCFNSVPLWFRDSIAEATIDDFVAF